MTVKLKSTGIKQTRIALLEQQGGLCAICGLECSIDQAVLDHNHKSGCIRSVLHRGCNAVEGKILNAMKRYGIRDPEVFLIGLLKYHRTHSTDQTGLTHPSHFTTEEKIERRKAKAKRARAKTKAEKLKNVKEAL